MTSSASDLPPGHYDDRDRTTTHRYRLNGPIAAGGPKFLAVFGSVVLLIWGMIAVAGASAENALTGGNAGAGYAGVAIVFWIVAILSMYMAFSCSRHGQRASAAGAILSLLVGLGLGAGWVFWWLFSGGLIGLAVLLSARASHNPRHQPTDS